MDDYEMIYFAWVGVTGAAALGWLILYAREEL